MTAHGCGSTRELFSGKQSTGGRRGTKPQFTSELWNQYGCVVDERPRHNNHMESNNRKLQRLIKENPSMWDFMEGLRSAYKGDYNLIYQVGSHPFCLL